MLHLCTRTNQAAVPGRLTLPRVNYRPVLRRRFLSTQSWLLSRAALALLLAGCSLSILSNSFEFAFHAHWTRNM